MRVDAHCHVFPPAFRARREELLRRDATLREMYSAPEATMASAEDLVAALDEAEFDAAVVVGVGWTDPELARQANDYLLESTARYRRLAAFCSVSPVWGDAAVEETERCAAGGAIGVGELHPDTQGYALDDAETLGPLMEAARRLGLPVLTHASEPVGHRYPGKGATTPDRLLGFIEAFPDNTIVAAHWGGGLPFYALMPEVAPALRNVSFDSAASPLLYDASVFRTAVGLVGADRVLFGTDFPLVRHGRLLRQVRESGLTASQQDAILGGNAARLFGLPRQGLTGAAV